MRSLKSFFQNLFKSKWEKEFEKETDLLAEEAADLIAPVMDKISRGEYVEFIKCVRCGADAFPKELLNELKEIHYLKGLGPFCRDCRETLKP